MWCVAELNEDYIAKMEDVLETYEQPYDPKQPVVCLDEKPVTLHADVRPTARAAPGREARRDNEYERCGTANVFCAAEPKAGRHFTFATPECCLRREFATATWGDDFSHDQLYFGSIVHTHRWSEENGDIVTIHEPLCRANADPVGGLRSGRL